MTDKEVLFHEMHLPALLAEQEYKQRQAAGTLTPDTAYTLILSFTGDENEADRVRASILAEEIRAKSGA